MPLIDAILIDGLDVDKAALRTYLAAMEKNALVLLATGTAAASAAIDFTAGIDATYDEYVLTIADLIPATDAVGLSLRVSQDGGSTFKSGATDYSYSRLETADGVATGGSGSAAQITLTGVLSNVSTRSCSGEIRFFNPAGTAKRKYFNWSIAFTSSVPANVIDIGVGVFTLNTTAINGIRILMSGGNITSGRFALYGVKKA